MEIIFEFLTSVELIASLIGAALTYILATSI